MEDQVIDCPYCNGSGKAYPHCARCGGNGMVSSDVVGGRRLCPECQDLDCVACDGKGKLVLKEDGKYARQLR